MKTTHSSPAALALALALATLACLGSSAAVAGEVSLFEGAGFNGRAVTVRTGTPSISNVGFNDRASSLVVRSGRWEICSDDEFKGSCAIFEPGQYATLDARFDKRISSLRELAVVGGPAQSGVAAGVGSVQLFGQPDFNGRTAQIDRDARAFNSFNFNDRAASLIVQGNAWELCTDADYRGTCRTFAPGRYPSLGYGMSKAISSARPVVLQQSPPVVHGHGRNRQRREGEAANSPIVLFSDDGINGRSMAVSGDMTDLSNINFNDMAQSVVIDNGYWEFCSDSYYRGTCRVLGPGQYPRLEPALYRSISSIRAASRDTRGEPQAPAARGDVELFTGQNFTGNRYPVRQDLGNFEEGGFNDQIGSIIVNAGQWQMCVDAGYRGSCTVFGPGRYPGLGGLTNQLSSIRRLN